jgi:hypothetical protein
MRRRDFGRYMRTLRAFARSHPGRQATNQTAGYKPVTMREIRPLTSADLPELSRFLTAGFHMTHEADFATPEVLHWKYLESPATEAMEHLQDRSRTSAAPSLAATSEAHAANSILPRSFVARNQSGRIIGHVGLCRTAFVGHAINELGGCVPTIHIIDWLGSPDHRAIGMSLMRKAHEGVPTQFGLGVSSSALIVGERAGYELRELVPVYLRVLRTRYWLQTATLNPLERGLRLIQDTAYHTLHRPISAPVAVALRRVQAFGTEIESIVSQAGRKMIFTRRDPARLNAFLRFPRQAMSGWHLLNSAGHLCGIALLNLIPQDLGRTLTGKVVDCLLDDDDVELWHAAILSLTEELAHQGADLALAYASTPWAKSALQRSGYNSRFDIKFHIRDRQGLIPRHVPFHLTPLEGDYAYT